ncbi:alpha/beta hydrolase [Streptomyces sp. NPDC019396]|uniref:alpha/beta hydrolase n=1 Tax=Streptomyces sp. NPDC019396 TaxID=3154687 RepID=UPI0033D290B9
MDRRTAHTAALLAAGAVMGSLAVALPSAATNAVTGPQPRQADALTWRSCATKAYPRLECSEVAVPLDHARPDGRKITIALSRVRHTDPAFQGPLLVNPGGPGASGLHLAGYVAAALPAKVSAQYDVIGFDPRGVGASAPALTCRPGHFAPVRRDPVPRTVSDESAQLVRARAFARDCGRKYPDLLPHLSTVNAAKDMDLIRAALRAERISYFGYSYGTYLGAVYARQFPHRVRRAVLDSVVDPDGVWYEDNLGQDLAFDARHKAFAAWVARHHATYRLGNDPAGVEAAWYAVRESVRRAPAGGKVGPGELEDTFLPGGYDNRYWPRLANAFAAYALHGRTQPLLDAYEALGAVDSKGENGYSVYTAVECRDAPWPRSWPAWRADNTAIHAKAPFFTWSNAWYNAPCAFWPVPSLGPVDVANTALPPVLLFQATDDAATPYEGAVTMHRKLHGSRLVVERGGGNHGVSLSGNACLDRYLTDYLSTGTLPPAAPGDAADAFCAARPEPEPPAAQAAAGGKSGGEAGAERTGGAPHGMHGLGHPGLGL